MLWIPYYKKECFSFNIVHPNRNESGDESREAIYDFFFVRIRRFQWTLDKIDVYA